MNAEELIEQFKALPLEERRKVYDWIRLHGPEVQYVSKKAFEESLDRVFTEHRELFRRLAQND